jgi:hypothetical protein
VTALRLAVAVLLLITAVVALEAAQDTTCSLVALVMAGALAEPLRGREAAP